MLNYYKNCSFVNLLFINHSIEKSYNDFEDLLYSEYGKSKVEEMYLTEKFPDKIYISGIDGSISREDLLMSGLLMNNTVDIEKMKLLSKFVESVGFSLDDGISCFYTFSNFLDKEEYADLFKITTSFNDFLDTNDSNLDTDIISELEKYSHLRFFENDTFIFIPDYHDFIDNDVLHDLPNFVYKIDGYAVRFRKGIGRSSYSNFDKSYEDFESMLYSCLLSTIDE